MQFQLIPVLCMISKNGACWNLKPCSVLGFYSFKWIVPFFVTSVLSYLTVKPAETFVLIVSYKENKNEKTMISWIIHREDLIYKSLTCYLLYKDLQISLCYNSVWQLLNSFICKELLYEIHAKRLKIKELVTTFWKCFGIWLNLQFVEYFICLFTYDPLRP